MGKETGIQWTDSTVNPTTGCDGCELWHRLHKGPCYAGALHEGRLAVSRPELYGSDFTEVRLAPVKRIDEAAAWSDLTGRPRSGTKNQPPKPWLDGMPRLIFVGDMGDIFSKAVPLEWLWSELICAATSPKGRRHNWQLLTKRPSRMVELAAWMRERGHDWPANVWAGTSVTSAATLTRVAELAKVPAAVRFVSYEPAIGWADMTDVPGGGEWRLDALRGIWSRSSEAGVDHGASSEAHDGPRIHQVIIGGESDQGDYRARPFDVEWARQTIAACRAADVAVFVKQLGSRVRSGWTEAEEHGWRSLGARDGGGYADWRLRDSHGGDWDEWPEDLRVREVPQAAAVGV